MPVSAHPHCFPSKSGLNAIYRNDAANHFAADSSDSAHRAPTLAHSSHYLKIKTKLALIRADEAKNNSIRSEMLRVAMEWQELHRCCRPDRPAYCRRCRTGGPAPRETGRMPAAARCGPPGTRCRVSGAYATASPGRVLGFLHGKLTWIKSSTPLPRPPTRCCASSPRRPRSRNSASTSAA
ncbi:hypothetical protein BDI4_1100002 [Burkholderia diffusa]|nr:hypothetical protein BDI4_1100002 [Burkholderia diffusa]